MSTPIQIRPAEKSDIPVIRDIYAESVRNGVATYELVPPDLSEMELRFAAITEKGYPFIVVEEASEIAGYAYASAFRTRAAYRFIVEDSIYLSPAFRGRGHGRRLLERLVVDASALGFRQMIAVIGGANPASIAVHRSAGFSEIGVMRGSGFKFGRWLDTVLMQLQLGEGNAAPPVEGVYPDTLYRD